MQDTHTRETEAKENDSEEDAGDGDETLDGTTPETQVGGHITGVQGNDNEEFEDLFAAQAEGDGDENLDNTTPETQLNRDMVEVQGNDAEEDMEDQSVAQADVRR
jgi:hypothetical protein